MSDKLLSRQQAAETLGISTRTLDRLIKSGSVKSVSVGRRVMVRESDLQAYIEGLNGEQ